MEGREHEADELRARLRQAGSEELLELLRSHLQELDAPDLRQAFRNPHLDRRGVELILAERHLLTFQEVRRELVRHRQTPEVQALRLIPGLFWKDLVDLAGDARVRPRLRRAAERQLLQRLPGLAVGERVAIARRAGPLLLAQLRQDTEARVIAGLLENPRLTEGALLPLVSSETARPEILRLVARDAKWGSRYPIRLALARNRRTPTQTSLATLPFLKKTDLKSVESDPRLPAALRRRASTLLGNTPS